MADDPNFIPEDQVGGGAPSAAPDASAAPAAPPPDADFIPEDQVHGAASSDADTKAGAFGAGMLKGIPFAKDIASAAVPVIKKAASYLPQNEDQKTALSGLPDSYTQARDQLDQNASDLNTAHPGYGFAGNMAGGAMMAPFMGGSGGIGQAIKSGLTYGAAQGAGEGRGYDRLTSAGTGAVAGGLGGLAGGMIAAPFQGAAKSAATDAASAFGVDLPRAVAGNPMQQGAAKVLGATPVGGAIQHATDSAVGQVGGAIADQAATIGGGTKQSAVDNAVPAIRDWLDQGTKKEAQAIYAPLSPLNNSKALGDMPNTRAVAQELLNQQAGKNAEAAMPPAVQDVLDAATRPGGLTFGQMNGLKQDLGRSASWDARGDSDGFKRLYGALNDDVRAHAQAIGGNQGLVAFDQANTQFGALMDRASAVRKMVGARPDEGVFDKFASLAQDMVGGKQRGGDMATIQHVQQSIPEASYNELVSGMVGGLGQRNGAQGTMKDFLSDWSAMSPRSKDTVFNTAGTQQVRQNIDQIATIAQTLKDAKTSSGSHMGGQFAAVEQGMELLHSVAEGKWGKAGLIAGTAVGGRQLSQYLASPVGSGALANVMKSYANYVRTPSDATMQMVRATAAKAGQILGTRLNPMQSEGQARQ